MTEEENSEIPASEEVVAVAEDHSQEDHSEDQKMVPLTALQETRRKLQEAVSKQPPVNKVGVGPFHSCLFYELLEGLKVGF